MNMKNRLLVFLSFLLVLVACKKDEHKIYYESGTAPAFTVTNLLGSTVLVQSDLAKPFLKMAWTNPNYQFTTGVSSQDVTYILQIDTTGANFTSPLRQEISIAKN